MPRRFDQLDLGDTGPDPADQLTTSRRDYAQLLAEVSEMLDSGDYDYAWGYLQDLQRTLQQTERCTSRQIEAVQNIKAGADRHAEQQARWDEAQEDRYRRGGSRRYEGFQGRNR